MPFQRPSLQTIIDRISADLESRLNTPQLRRSNAKVYSRVMAGVSHALHSHIDFIARQMFFDTAEAEFLDRWASIYGLQRKLAGKAEGVVSFTYSAESVDIPVGTLIQSETGSQYETTSAVTDGNASVRALIAGVDGNLDSGDVLTLVSPIAGVLSQCVTLGIAGGSADEDDDSLRSRLLSRVRQTPHAGTKSDYEAWALEVSGVTRAWVYPLENGNGTVVVRFVCDDLEDIVPSAEQIKLVQSHIDSVRPVTARVTVRAPSIQKVNFTIANLEPDDESVKSRIKEGLQALFEREASPGGLVYLSHIRAAISAAVGEVDHTLVSPSADVVPSTGVLLVVGDFTWQ